MRKTFLKVLKIGLVLVLIGFFCPVACNQNGLEIIGTVSNVNKAVANQGSRLFMAIAPYYAVFLFPLALFLYGLVRMLSGRKESLAVSWALFLPGLSSACYLLFYVFANIEDKSVSLNFGAYIIISGYALSLLFLLCATLCKDDFQKLPIAEQVRQYCIEEKIKPARSLKARTIEISAADVCKNLKLDDTRFVFSLLSDKEFLESAEVRIASEYDESCSLTCEIL